MAFLAAMPLASVFSAVGSIASAGLGLAMGAYQKQVADMNAKIAEENAIKRVEIGNEDAQKQDNMTRALIGEQVAVQSASGLGLNSKSAILTRKAAKKRGREDSLNIREAAGNEAGNFLQQAANFRAEGKGAMMQGIGGAISGLASAGGSLVGGATSSKKTFYANPTARPASLVY